MTALAASSRASRSDGSTFNVPMMTIIAGRYRSPPWRDAELWADHWKDNPRSFIRHLTAEDIIAKVRRGRAALTRPTSRVPVADLGPPRATWASVAEGVGFEPTVALRPQQFPSP